MTSSNKVNRLNKIELLTTSNSDVTFFIEALKLVLSSGGGVYSN